MSYESEERYWTDYLRVALPVIGLLLMLALFWWWAQNFIGDEGNPSEVAQATQTEIATVPVATATTPAQPTVVVTQGESNPATPPDNGGVPEQTPGDQPTDAPEDCGFSEGDNVVTTDSVRIRSDPSTADDSNIIDTLDPGTELQIISSCYTEDGDNKFWQVKVRETSDTGWVADTYLAASDQ
jgi:hypothetical protein